MIDLVDLILHRGYSQYHFENQYFCVLAFKEGIVILLNDRITELGIALDLTFALSWIRTHELMILRGSFYKLVTLI